MRFGSKGSLLVGVLAALGASACCVGPLLLVLLGVSGSWLSGLAALEAYRSLFTVLTLLFLGLAFYDLYIRHRICLPADVCAALRVLANQRSVFWLAVAVVILLLTFPMVASRFYQ